MPSCQPLSEFAEKDASQVARVSARLDPAAEQIPAELDFFITDDFTKVEGDWARLLQSGIGVPYQGPEWCRSYQETLGGAHRTRPVLVRITRDGSAVLVLPLALRKTAGLLLLEFLGSRVSNQNTGIWDRAFYAAVDPATIRELLVRICRDTGADGLILENVPETWHDRRHPLALSGARPSPSPVFARPLADDFPALFAKTHTKSARKNLTRKQRHLQEAGGYAIHLCREKADIDAGLAAFLSQREVRARTTGIPNAFSSPHAQAFLNKATGLAGDPEIAPLSIWTLTAGGRIRATYLCARHGATLYAYSNSVAHDEMLKNSPGLVLIREIIETACQDPGLSRLDLGLGEERYKTDWTAAENLCDSFLAVTAKGRIAGWLQNTRQRLKTAIRNSNLIWPLVRRLRRLRAPGG